MNTRGLEALGYTAEDLENGLNVLDILPEEDVDRFKKRFDKLIGGQPQPSIEYRLLHKDGTQIDIVAVSSPIYKNDTLVGARTSATPIAEKKLAEKALKESEEKYRLLIESLTDLVVKVDPDGRFLFVSPSYCETFGKTEQELLGAHFMPLVHPDDRESTKKEMESLYRPPHTAYVRQRALTKDGWRWLAWADRAILDEQGNIVAIQGLGRDITPQKRFEELHNNPRSAAKSHRRPRAACPGRDRSFRVVPGSRRTCHPDSGGGPGEGSRTCPRKKLVSPSGRGRMEGRTRRR